MTDPEIDSALGVQTGGWTVESAGRLNGDLISRGSKAFDGDPSTWWQSQIDVAPGVWIDWSSPTPATFTFDGLDVVNDPNHSVPTAVHLEVDGVAQPTIELSRAGAIGRRWSVTSLSTPAPATVTGSHIRLVIDRLDVRTQPNWRTKAPSAMPIGIAELRVGAPLVTPGPARLDPTCQGGLVRIGDTAVALRLDGTAADAEAGRPIPAIGCNPASVAAAPTLVIAEDGRRTGRDIDSLTLGSPGASSTVVAPTPAEVSTTRTSRGSYDLSVDALNAPTWLVLGQSLNDGWHLTSGGKDLGPPLLVNGFANGWLLDPAVVGEHPRMTLEWTPQKIVWLALALSGIGFILCLVLALWPQRRRREDQPHSQPMSPVAIGLTDAFGAAVTWRTTMLVGALSASASLLLITPWWWSVVVGGLAIGAMRSRRGWVILRFACLGALGLAAAFVVAKQWRNEFPDDFDWPQKFDLVHPLGMVSALLLGVELSVEAIRAGWRRTAGLDGS